ncbi:MAG: glutathione-disulfide reductase [Gammaproteobacteria bacterium]|nr:glutathione-disulfide reductase [Gammaproteobacteria bacterium]
MSQAFDLIVIGAGSGGVRAARIAAELGARVAIIEQGALGGTCVNLGCIPKKLFVYSAHFADEFEDAAGFGWNVPRPMFDWPTLRDNTAKEIKRLNGIYQGLLEDAGVEIFLGVARLLDRNRVAVGERELAGERILIATGSRAFVPDWPGREHVITSDDAFSLDSLPERAVIVGGGYIAVEFAGIFARLGVDTTLLYRGPMFLRGFDDGVREFVADELKKTGLTLRFGDTPQRIDKTGDSLRIETESGTPLETDLVLAATGRLPNTDGLALEEAGVVLGQQREIVVGQDFASSVPHIYAIGDVINRVQLTPVAIAEGAWLASHLFGGTVPASPDYARIATAVFCQPPIGTVGMTEQAARAAYGDDIHVYESEFRPLKHVLTENAERTLMKLVARASDDRVVGVHMAGADAGEIIQGFSVALTAGATKAQFDTTMAIHPTSAEEFVTMRTPRA